VDGHQLLLFADRGEKAKGLIAESDQPDEHKRKQGQSCARRHPHPLAAAGRSEHDKGEREPGGDLHAHAHRERDRGRSEPRARCCGHRKRERQQHHRQRVDVRAADGQYEQGRVQSHEGGGATHGAVQAPGCARNQRDRAEAREHSYCLQRPESACEPERRRQVAREREQRTIGGGRWRGRFPAQEREYRVAWRFGGGVGVGAEAMQGPKPGEAEVAEHILGDQRWPQEQDQMGRHDCRGENP